VLQRLCGLLNNNVEGSMFFGLSIDSVIEGVRLQREDKDVLRNGNHVPRIQLYRFYFGYQKKPDKREKIIIRYVNCNSKGVLSSYIVCLWIQAHILFYTIKTGKEIHKDSPYFYTTNVEQKFLGNIYDT
jgi:hypothetical protein